MPYAEDVALLPPDPVVKIFLQGQLILEPQADKTCDIGVNRSATKHEFSFELRQRMVDPIPDVVIMRILGEIELPDVKIGLKAPAGDGVTGKGAKRLIPTEEFERAETDDPQDFRWLVDLSSKEFHNANVDINGNDTEPSITIMDGIFYTAQRTDPKVVTVHTVQKAEDATGAELVITEPLNRIASLMGVNIYLPDDGSAKFKLKWTQNGVKETLILDKPTAESGIKHYELRINNDGPFVNPEHADPPAHKELREYYKVIDRVGTAEAAFIPFELLFEKPGSTIELSNLGSPTIPCMPVGGGDGGGGS